MPRTPKDVTNTELNLLEILWDRGQATVSELASALYPNGDGSRAATVLQLLRRLETKAFVARNRDVWPHVFWAIIGRDDLIKRRLQSTADRLCEGSLAPLLTNLVRARPLSVEERQMLRRLLDELDGGPDPHKQPPTPPQGQGE